MVRKLYLALGLFVLTVLPVQSIELSDSGIGFSKSNKFVKSSFNVGHIGLDVFTEGRVDVSALLAEADIPRSATAEEIFDRVNEVRKRMYPSDEIILSITPSQNFRGPVSGEKAGLVKAIIWWNNVNCGDCYWYAEYSSSVATMFISNIEYGIYNLYERVGSGNYIFKYSADAGDSATRYSYGAKTIRGFRGYAGGVTSKADIVIYFFK